MKMTFEEAENFFSVLYFGKHHIPSKIKSWGQGWTISHYGDLSTYDFNTLTRLVFLAHDMCFRAEISQSGPRMVKISIHKRSSRRGSMFERHPTIEEALADWREKHPKETE
jgi:hypothetical protein